MFNLYLINDLYTNGYKDETLDIFSLIAILCGILVIVSKNPIVSVLFLIGLFLGISCYLVMLGLSFIGLSYLLVYVGAVSILFLFILMLINVRISELLSNTSNSLPLAVIIAIFFSYPVYQILPYTISFFYKYIVYLKIALNKLNIIDFLKEIEIEKIEIYYATSKLWDGNLSVHSHITSIGNILYTSYSMWLILTSIILLLAMVGAIVITIKPKVN